MHAITRNGGDLGARDKAACSTGDRAIMAGPSRYQPSQQYHSWGCNRTIPNTANCNDYQGGGRLIAPRCGSVSEICRRIDHKDCQ